MSLIRSVVLFFIASNYLISQNWPTFGGDNSRSGFSQMSGPTSIQDLQWKITNAGITTLGNAVYTFGNKLVTSRVTFSPYIGFVECRELSTGSLLWKSPDILPTSILYCIGMNYDAVYVNDYSNGDIFALSLEDGKILWKSAVKSYVFGAYPGCVFACNGDPIIGGEPSKSNFTMRLDKLTGKAKWINKTLIAVTPNAALACNDVKVYRITGGITLPIKLTAIDIETGQNLYSSEPIPGDGDQENPITLGKDGMIYFTRDGGKFYAFKDNGSAFEIVWTYDLSEITGAALSGNVTIGPDDNIYMYDKPYIIKLDHKDGSVIESSAFEYNVSQPSMTIDADTNIYFNNGLGQFYCLTSDLQDSKWNLSAGNNVYSNMGVGQNGIMVLTYGGRTIQAYQTRKERKCVADFKASKYRIEVGEEIQFTDQSSYFPEEWDWSFVGAETTRSTLPNPTGIKYSKIGIYDVTLKVKNKFGENQVSKNCLIEVIDSKNSVYNLSVSQALIYPNPSSGFINIVMDENFDKEIVITNSIGNELESHIIKPGHNKINLEHLTDGFYFIIFKAENKVISKLMKI